ncbi:bromodomain adjacent to zinc finger domain protein 2B isoform X8 [Xenopus tropicalis]|uniref:Bromodomain adjacent to zinc finger domain protein 2B isoform X8 n=1 Tax=Xenopus tropicalis TaxID=8364 RepID=A0A8J0SW84_XENTR|nr:bromodomain adjacent to zinc finger domain protein 2B isoform X8 [Xenopus tropicalis]XP_012826524.1 bromodomain adjacent to zinc finger domain protein 2B isoform X8 [Xenopus tropicalis]|eukprot:XP_012826523.1 PREDICTED: bromodomain adjacent to zinc finger domain protein 2B isoform X8 [Xenopus tropicalis]
MESAERLTTSTPSSATSSSPSTPSVAAVVSKGGLSAGVSPLSSTITACGHLFRTSGDQPFNLSSAFPMVSHPIFGLHAASSGHSEFGGLGTLGTPTALAAHPQLAPFPGAEWWRTTDAHTRAAFFPPLLGIPPLFTPPTPNHDSPFHLRNSVKNGRGVPDKGMNGSMNGSSPTLVTSNCTSILSTTSASTVGQTKTAASGATGRLSKEEQSKSDGRSEKTKDKKQRKKAAESSSSSDSGSSSDTSSDGVSSSDSDDLEEEEDQSIEESDDDDSDSESEAQTKNKNKVLLHNLKTDGNKPEKSQEKRTHQQIPLIPDSQTRLPFQSQQKHPQVLSQHLPFAFPSSQAKEEAVNKHTSVIQCTGLISKVKPLTLLNHSNKDNGLKLGTPSTDGLKAGTKNTSEESAPSDLRIKRDQHKATYTARISKPQESSKHQKKSFAGLQVPNAASGSLGPHATSIENNHSNPFLTNALLGNHHPNGVLPNVIQDVPLALTTKTKSQGKTNDSSASAPGSQFSSPINLSSSVRKNSSSQPPLGPISPPVLQSICKEKAPGKPNSPAIKTSHRVGAAKSLLDKFRGTDSDIPSSKDSDDSNEEEDEEDDDEDDEEEDEDDEEDDSDSQSESDSNSESDSDGSEEDDDKDQDDSDSDTEGEKKTLKLNKTTPSLNSTTNSITAHSTPLNLQVIKNPGSAPASLCPEAQTQDFLASSSTLSPSTPCGSGKRRRVTDERELGVPLEYGWQRETRIKNLSGRLQGEVTYYAPCGKKFRQYPEVMKGMQWYLLKEEEIVPRIRAMEGRRGRPPNPEKQLAREESRMRRRKGRPPNVGSADFTVNDDAKLLRKLQAQEIARQAAQIKLLRKLQRQEQARAAKEAKKQQAIMAAEEKRKQKEQIKILKQQEKIKRIEQVRMEKELRAQQILEAKKKKKEEAAIAKIMEAEKRTKAKEMRRQQAVLLKHQELERHRLDMVWERERRRQHVMLLKAVEARKKAEERERLKQEKQDEKRLNKERKLEQRRLELELAKELKKPTEDMCLADHKPFPELPRIPGLVLCGSTFSNCLMVVQFLRNFGKVLDFDIHKDIPTLSVIQEGLLNMGDSMGEVQDLLVRLLSAAVCDPGVPPGYKAKTALGEHILNIGINRDNVSEVLQIFMEAHCGQTDITESLKTKAFQAHSPEQKSSILAFLVNELACSKSVVSEIDKNIDHMSNLRRDKWMVEGKLRKLRMIHAKKTGKKDSIAGSEGSEEQQSLGTPTQGRKRRRKGADSDYDDDDDDDSDDQAEDEDEEDEDKKGKKVETCDDEDDGDQTATVEELEKQIDKLLKQQNQYRKKLFESSHCLRSMMFGQDRYRRRYWILPQCGGIFVEGMESGEGPEEMAKERERKRAAENIQIKEEMLESYEEKVNCLSSGNREQKDKDSTNLFLQKPGSFSKLSKLLEVAKMPPEMDVLTQKANASPNGCSLAYKNNCRGTPNNLQPSTSHGNTEKPDSSSITPPVSGSGKFYNSPVIPNEQLLKTLTDKNRQWFSLLPRAPCDDTSLTYLESSPAVTTAAQCRLPSQPPSPVPSPVSSQSPVQNTLGINPFTLSPLQMKPGVHLMGLQFCGWPSPVLPANLPFSTPVPGMGLTPSDGNSHSFLTPASQPSKSESPIPQSDKSICTPPSAVEVPKQVDFPTPRPIPEEMQFGWWRVTDPEDLKSLLKVLHLRGIREKSLQKQIQKHLEYITQTCMKTKDVTIIEMNGPEECQLTRDIVENWSVEDQEMEVDVAILQQIEDIERRVVSASLQVKGWMCPEPASEREDLVYYEHKSVSKRHKEHGGERTTDEGSNAIERKSDNPLDIAVTRLTDLERNIERRYLKSPLSTTIQIKLDNVGTVTVPAPAPSINGDGDGTEDDIAPGLKVWRRALSEARSAAQVSLCIQQLQKSIAWEKSIMKVYCQICRKGDNEELLLLCDGCDKGCHTYCHRPKITTIPEGDWFCPACIAKASGHNLKMKKSNLKGKKSAELKKGKKSPGDTGEEQSAGTPGKKGSKDSKKRKGDENSLSPSKQESSPSSKKARSAKEELKDLSLCSVILSEMESHEDAWPFLLPVNLKLVPGYKKVIKKPMDFATIRDKLSNGQYPSFEAFALDVRLVFNNCETFNEDESEIGRAGHKMRVHFEKRWTELFNLS